MANNTLGLETQVVNLYQYLQAGEADKLLALFTGEPVINTPLQSEIRGEANFRQFVTQQQAWLTERRANSQLFNSIVTPERLVTELVVDLTQTGETFDLPVVAVFDRSGDGVTAIRVYHSTWPLTGQHIIRPPLLQPPAAHLTEPAIVQAYMAGLREPNEALVLSLFAENGYLREPSGNRYKHMGEAGLREFYDPALSSGGISLHHCTATYDGHTFAVEYICDEWAKVKLPAQAGLAIYEMAGPTKLAAVRIYDDVTPPFES